MLQLVCCFSGKSWDFFWLTQQRGKHKSFFGHWKMHGLVGGVDVIHYSLFELRHFKVPADVGGKNAKVHKEKKRKSKKMVQTAT